HDRSHDSSGFTLVEVLVVLSILTILAAILFPVFSAARAQARQAQCLSNYRQLGQAGIMYLQDNDERFMPSASSLKQNQVPLWPRSLAPYLGGPLMNLICPEV